MKNKRLTIYKPIIILRLYKLPSLEIRGKNYIFKSLFFNGFVLFISFHLIFYQKF